MKFFKPEDFMNELMGKPIVWPDGWQLMADIANKKLQENTREFWIPVNQDYTGIYLEFDDSWMDEKDYIHVVEVPDEK